jgi:hypothetical protein
LRPFIADSGDELHRVSRLTEYLAAGLGQHALRRVSCGAAGCFAERCVRFDGEDHRAHAASLGQDELLELATVELIDHLVELPHGVPNRVQFGVRDVDTSHL